MMSPPVVAPSVVIVTCCGALLHPFLAVFTVFAPIAACVPSILTSIPLHHFLRTPEFLAGQTFNCFHHLFGRFVLLRRLNQVVLARRIMLPFEIFLDVRR
jgi:hypothetical protein